MTAERATVLVAVLLVSSVVGAVAIAGASTADATPPGDTIDHPPTPEAPGTTPPTDHLRSAASGGVAAATQIHHEQTLQLTPDRPGSYDARSTYAIPDAVTSLEVTLPREATLLRAEGFVARGDGRYAWDGQTATPTLQFRVPANRTVDRDDPIAGPGDYLFVDVGDWAVVQRPSMGHSWGWQGDARIGLRQSLEADPGVAGDALAYLGEYEEHVREANGQRFRLVVPERADLAESPDEVLGELAYASAAMQVGERDDEVLAVAAPTEGVRWGVRGLQTGPADMWVRDFEPLDEADSVWLHEYVHTRQDYAAAPGARWFTEATASYYAALLALERDRIDYDEFRARLALGEADERFEGVVLADPATWRNNPDYQVGALTAAELDRRIRLATGGERTLQDAFRAMNGASEEVTGSDLRSYLKTAGGEDVAAVYDRYATTTERPRTWSIEAHGEAFGTLPARIGYDLADGDAVRVDGPYRNRTLEPGAVLVPGERITAEVAVRNAGGTAGDFEATLRLTDEMLDSQRGRLDPGASTTVTLSGTVEELGHHDLRVGDRRIPVEVREPATATVAGVSTNRSRVAPGEAVAVRTTVDNPNGWPGQREVALVAGGETVDRRVVRVDADGRRIVETVVRFDDPGRYRVGVEGTGAAATVRVGDGTTPWGVIGGLVGAVALVAALAVRYRSERE